MELRDARAKIRRAEEHICDLDTLIAEVYKLGFYAVTEVRDSQTGQKFIEYGAKIYLTHQDNSCTICT